ncbi:MULTISPECIES: beta-ketoacyl synthase N-terminal-like domain-containing protein [unclassified Streptomyces]|uniref:type I polyketide synthase n=1 Tax=unclassified Streptomyces TaxID=2593676 RepID=UPI003369EE83
MEQGDEIRDSDVAIIGMVCRFPGAEGVDAFWRNLTEGRESTTFFTDEELSAAGVGPDELALPGYVRAGQILPDIELFDAAHFKIPGDEAEILDPQHRLFLECSLHALEDAGYAPGTHDGEVGVFAGAGLNTYLLHHLAARYRDASSVGHYRLMLANDKDFLATRVSYKLDLRGPSLSVNTACSTSLVAVHQACLSLLSGECSMALAGAVHLRVPQHAGHVHQEGMIFSPDGHCRAFDAEARGTVIGSGVGVVVLKRLADALEDGDTVHAVVKGSAVNNDGAAKTGYTAPSVERQAAVIADAQDIADCPPETIGYVEAHGTGTPLGDPIEIAALNEAFGAAGGPGSCVIGSVKTNIGHLDTAAGMAGLMKTALMLREGTLVPSLNYRSPNPDIDFAAGPFRVGTETAAWPAGPGPRRAGVSSFGIGGTNAHVVLEEPPRRPAAAPPRPAELLVLSARTPQALDRLALALARHLRRHPGLDLDAVAYTLTAGRQRYPHRRAVVARTVREAALALAIADPERMAQGQPGEETPRPAFVFSGAPGGAGGARAVELYRELPTFRAAVRECAAALDTPPGYGADALLTADDGVAAFITGYALARVWQDDWGLAPGALLGTGPAQAVVGALAGVFGLADALALAKAYAAGEAAPLPRAPLGAPELPLALGAGTRWLTPEEARDPAVWTKPVAAEADAEARSALLATSGLIPVEMALDDEPGEPGVADGAGQPAEGGGSPATAALLRGVGRAWVQGAYLDWDAWYPRERQRRVPLPGYPFERVRHWVEPPRRQTAPAAPEPAAVAPTAPATPAVPAGHAVAPAPRPADGGGLAGRIAGADRAEVSRLLQEYVQGQVATVLGRGRDDLPELDRNLFDMDVDSLILIDITARLGTELDRPVPSSAFVEYPTIRAFADHLVAEWHGEAGPDGGHEKEPGGAAGGGEAVRGRTSRRAAARRGPGGGGQV